MPDNLSQFSGSEVRAEAGRIVALAWPIVLTGLNWTLMQIVDVAVVGQYGTDELAALGASRTLTWIAIVLGISALTGVLVYTAQADGGKRLAETGDNLRAGLMLGLALGTLIAVILGLWAYQLLALIDVEAGLLRPATPVVEAMALAFPAQLAFFAASYFLEGISRPRRVMIVNLGMLGVNAVLAWAWVGGHLGFPALGAVGAAYSTATASWAGALAMILFAWTVEDAAERGVRDFSVEALKRAARGVPRLLWFGTVPAIAASLELAGFAWLIVLSTQLGNGVAAAFQAMLAVHNLLFAIAYGFASAAGVRVGNAVGAGERDQAWPRALIAAGLSVAVIGLLSLFLVAFSDLAMLPFSDDPKVLAAGAAMLAIMASFLIFDGLQYLFGAGLRSLNEQVWAGINGIIGFFIVTGGLGWLLVNAGWGANGLAWAAAMGMLVTAALQFGRFFYVLKVRKDPLRSAARS